MRTKVSAHQIGRQKHGRPGQVGHQARRFATAGGVTEIDVIAEPERLRRLEIAVT